MLSIKFVGMVADDPNEKIKLKMFHSEIINDTDSLNKEMKGFKDIPVVSNVSHAQVMDNFYQVKYDIKQLIQKEVGRLIAEKEEQEAREKE